MVADGAGYNTWLATSYWEGSVGREFWDAPGWTQVAVSTYALRMEPVPPDAPEPVQDQELVYDPARAWNGIPEAQGPDDYPWHFAGYRWLRRAPDSANTATAMATGRRTVPRAINVDARGRSIEPTIVDVARNGDRRIGVVSSVEWSHATPAALGGAHNPSRKEYLDLAQQLLLSDRIDVLGGCGAPDYDADGAPRTIEDSSDWDLVGGPDFWQVLTGGAATGVPPEHVAALRTWDLRRSRGSIEGLAVGPTPDRLLMIPKVADTLQQERSSRADDALRTAPGDDPLLETVPSLAAMTRAALNALDDGPDGFFLHVEGGAVDWAMHDNHLGRMIEELIDFRASVAAVIEWIERESSWNETLLIVTSDHDHMLWGPDADRVPFDPLRDRGPRALPEHRWLSDYHSCALVPLFAKGPGAESFRSRIEGSDPRRGPWVAQTEIFRVMAEGLGADPSPGG